MINVICEIFKNKSFDFMVSGPGIMPMNEILCSTKVYNFFIGNYSILSDCAVRPLPSGRGYKAIVFFLAFFW